MLKEPAETPPALRAAFSSSEQDEKDLANMIASAVIESIGVTTRWARDQLYEQARMALREHPDDFEGISNGMIAAWKEYCACVKLDKMRSPPVSPEKFFGEGKWKSSKLWGLKKGMTAYGESNAA